MYRTIIGIDLGTTGCRSIVFNEDLEILGEKYVEYPLIKLSNTEIEQDANLWWELTKQVIRGALDASGVPAETVQAMSISSQGIAFVPVDRNCRPLRNALSWLDTRAVKETGLILERFSAVDIFSITGKRASAGYLLPKLLWLRNNENEIYRKTYKFLMPQDFILCKLCGEFVTDHTMASGTLLYDVSKQQWSQEILKQFDIDSLQLPHIEWSGSLAGLISQSVAAELGLPRNLKVFVGGQDQKCAAFGAGISDSIITISLGTAAAMTRRWDYPNFDTEMRIPLFTDLTRNRWVSEGVIGTVGASLKWLKTTFFDANTYEAIDKSVEMNSWESTLLFYPHLIGCGSPGWYEGATGCYYGINLNTQRYEFARALLEGIAFQIKSNISIMDDDGADIKELRLFGGGAKSGVWCQIIADITGRQVTTLTTNEAACAGAAMLAGIGAGIYKNAQEAGGFVKLDSKYEPDMMKNARYEEKYRQYKEIENRLWGHREILPVSL